MGGERIMTDLSHTHYNPYGSPRQVPGTLIGCSDSTAHDPRDSEIFADYMYAPRLVPSHDTGLPHESEAAVLTAFRENYNKSLVPVITDVVPDEEHTVRVSITARTLDGRWHTTEWGLRSDGEWFRIPKNPHPGYEHWPAFCPNCGY
jgi:hypothetical protein